MLLTNHVAVITGGAGLNGLGFATAGLMAAQGAKVAILALTQAERRERSATGTYNPRGRVTDAVSWPPSTPLLTGLNNLA